MFRKKKDNLDTLSTELHFKLEKLFTGIVAQIDKTVRFSDFENLLKERTKLIESLKEYIDKQLQIFYKEFMDKYSANLEKLLDWSREVTTLSKLDDKALGELRRILLQPYLDNDWLKKRVVEAERINKVLASKGEILRKEKKWLYDEILRVERTTSRPAVELRTKLKTLEGVIG